MNNQQAYNQWALTYNEVANKTRDVELKAKKDVLRDIHYSTVLELGCGTGKNTEWLLQKAAAITAVDFSESMMAKAKERVNNNKVDFIQADINEEWSFVKQPADLVTCSLVLEHIEHLNPVFEKAFAALNKGGHFYIGELHPFKQYAGSKARFDKEQETLVLDCYTHHTSEFTSLAAANGFSLINLNEWFDNDNKQLPRILTLLFRKN
ncbi:MAG: class I SAM-dependent methyltransferase [Rhizobacter sp.]|nr:class I SAM-dependent methyltransferase [Ferruginibacter sp.]